MKAIVAVVVIAALFACGMSVVPPVKTGMPAPQIMYSVTVTNDLEKPVDVDVRYEHPFENRIIVDHQTLKGGEQHFFDRRDFETVDHTSFAATISEIIVKDVDDVNKEAYLNRQDFKIYSPTSNYQVRVVSADNPAGFDVVHAAKL